MDIYSRASGRCDLLAALLVAVTVALLLLCVATGDALVMVVSIAMLLCACVAAFMVRREQRMASDHMRAEKERGEGRIARFLRKIARADKPEESPASGEDAGKQTPLSILMSDLAEEGIPSEIEDDVVSFRYQGGFFYALQTTGDLIRLAFPRICSVPVSRQDFLCRLLNRVNSAYALCKLVGVSSESEPVMEVHGFADLFYKDSLADRRSMLRTVLALFFEQQRDLVIGMAVNDAVKIALCETTEADATTAYRNISLN